MQVSPFFQRQPWALIILLGLTSHSAQASVISFANTDFTMNPNFNRIRDFEFSIDIAADLTPGTTYNNPALNSIEYNVFGILDTDPTPSGFPAFDLQRTILGSDFYTQGSSLNFTILPTADLSDGLQLSELAGTGTVFELNGREMGTGRYHPSLVELNANGTGRIQNSNNIGGVNPGNGMVVDVDFGEEYIVDLTFNPSTLTIAAPIPEPSILTSCGLGLSWTILLRRRTRSSHLR
ncbi:MAG: hypothetical protein ACSHYB_15445 [Roseibacillus sp.]